MKKKDLKIDNSNSIFSKLPKKPSAQEFKEKVSDVVSKQEEYRQRISELAIKFKSILLDKTLDENKTVLSKDIENEILKKFLSLSEEINCDENEKEGKGSEALCAILFRAVLIHRDRANSLEYRLEKLEKEFARLNLENKNSG